MNKTIETKILPFVDKPGRYIGNEINSVLKEKKGRTGIALIYPDIYEIGMSNIGLKILYNIVNSRDEFFCERAFSPDTDMEEMLRKYQVELFSLESKTPLGQLDALGFTFQYELLYTNFLNILDLSHIPFYSRDRLESNPIIIAGGPVSNNLEPIAPFLDVVCLGDGETAILEILTVIRKSRLANLKRAEILEALSKISGVYVPELYTTSIQNGYVIPYRPPIKRRIEPDINDLDFVTHQMVSNTEAVQERAVVEVTRGCTQGCRFCQAGYHYRPVRERSVAELLELSRNAILQTGYSELSLISLSISDYSNLPLLIEGLDRQLTSHGISFSLPSLRMDSFTLELAQKVKEIRKSGLTFAVEGGSQNLRNSINKNIHTEDILKVIAIAKNLGWKSVKLYFMLGLPFTTPEEEIKAIIELIDQVSTVNPSISLTISIAVFIPKPHTPFQWHPQLDPVLARDLFHKLIDHYRRKSKINIRYNDSALSYLEGVMSRGDRALSVVVLDAFQKGARFDGWSDRFNKKIWEASFASCNINPQFYLEEKLINQPLPWEHLDNQVSKEFLLSELDKAQKEMPSEDCRNQCAHACGSCDFQLITPVLNDTTSLENLVDEKFLDQIDWKAKPSYQCKIEYSKLDTAKYFRPIELENIFARALIRSNIPVCFTQGFNPRIRIEFGMALPLGFSSKNEYCEFQISKIISSEEIIKSLNFVLPFGLKIKHCKIDAMPAPHLSRLLKDHLALLVFDLPEELKSISVKDKWLEDKINSLENYEKITSKNKSIISLKEYINKFEIKDNQIHIEYLVKEGGARIQDIIQGITGLNTREAVVINPIIVNRYHYKNEKKEHIFGI